MREKAGKMVDDVRKLGREDESVSMKTSEVLGKVVKERRNLGMWR